MIMLYFNIYFLITFLEFIAADCQSSEINKNCQNIKRLTKIPFIYESRNLSCRTSCIQSIKDKQTNHKKPGPCKSLAEK